MLTTFRNHWNKMMMKLKKKKNTQITHLFCSHLEQQGKHETEKKKYHMNMQEIYNVKISYQGYSGKR